MRVATSKRSQAHAVEIVVPCEDMPNVCAAMERWVKLAALQPGEPIFRPAVLLRGRIGQAGTVFPHELANRRHW